MTRKHPPPFSLRLAPEERARLEREAGDKPLGTHIREVLLGPRKTRGKAAVHDPKALSQALALLGQSRLASNLNQLAKAANRGVLPLTPDTEADLRAACADVAAMRAQLVAALGLKDGRR